MDIRLNQAFVSGPREREDGSRADEATVVALARSALENFSYSVKTASGTCEAIARLEHDNEAVQVMIVDLNLPFLDGLTTAVASRKSGNRLQIIVTGGSEKDLTHALREQLGVEAFVPKPFNMKKLLKTIHAVLTRNTEN